MSVSQRKKGDTIQEGIISIHRKKFFSIVISIAFILCLFFMFYQFYFTVELATMLPTINVFDPIGSSIISFLCFGMVLWVWHLFTRHIFQSGPALTIDSKGIEIGKLPMVYSGIFLAWNEIGMIYIKHDISGCLCIRPKDPAAYFSKCSIWQRFGMRMTQITRWGEPIVVPQSYLKTSIETILQQVQEGYGSVLREQNIQLTV